MHSGAQFAEILAEKVGRFGASGRPAAASRPAYAKAHHPVVLFFHSGTGGTVMDSRVARAYGAAIRPGAAAAPKPAAEMRPTRVLTERQQQALAHFVGLGARLHADFTSRELRSAFRLLARLYHPDRHPGCSEFEKARLSRLFAGLHEAYRQLLTSIPLPPAA